MSRVLLDECTPARLARHLTPAHSVSTVQRMRWTSTKDGRLLERAQAEFDVLVTNDQSLPKQNNIPAFDIAVIVLVGRSNRLADMLPLVPALVAAIDEVRPGEVREIRAPSPEPPR